MTSYSFSLLVFEVYAELFGYGNCGTQMRPTGYPTDGDKKALGVPQKPRWRKSENCPQGTVPIRRTLKSDLLRAQSLESFGRRRPPQYTFATNNAGAHEVSSLNVHVIFLRNAENPLWLLPCHVVWLSRLLI